MLSASRSIGWAAPLVGAAFLVLLAGSLEPAAALEPHKTLTQYGHRTHGADDGLPQWSVQTIVQTRNGYLWAGTQAGLARFDGVAFTVFDRRNTPELRSDNIFGILEDAKGDLWVATGGGGLCRIGADGAQSFTTAEGLPNDLVHSLLLDRSGDLWIGTASGLARMRNGVFVPVPGANALAEDRIWSIEEDAGGTIWIGTDRGLVRLRDGIVQRFRTAEGLSGDRVRVIHEDSSRRLWIGTSAGLDLWKEGEVRSFEGMPGAPGEVVALREDRHGSLWIGAADGLVRFRDERFERFPQEELLARERIWSLAEDKEGSLWVGTQHGGLHQLLDSPVTILNTTEGLGHQVAWSVLEDRRARMWVGTGGGGLTRFDEGKSRTFTRRDGLPSDFIYALLEDRRGDVWVGTEGGGIVRIRGEEVEPGIPGLANAAATIRDFHEDARGAIWMGTDGKGLYRYENGAVTRFGQADGLANESVFALEEDAAGNLWVGTFGGGLFRLRDGIFQHTGREDGLSNEVVLALHAEPDGTLWIGTNGGGLSRLRHGAVTNYSSDEGLLDDVIFSIVPDGNGNLWMSSNRGIFRVSLDDLAAVANGERSAVDSLVYGKPDGMKSSECNGGQHPAGWKHSSGALWFPTTDGVAIVDLQRADAEPAAPPLVVERLIVDGQFRPFLGETEIPSSARRFEAVLSAPTFLAPERIRYRYRLRGFDDDWVVAGADRTAHYTNLPPGRFRLEVAASNDRGRFSDDVVAFDVIRNAAFHESNLFYLLCAGSVLFGTYGAHKLRTRRYRQRERMLSLMVEDRTRQLADANAALESEAAAARSLAEARATLLSELELKNEELGAFSFSVSHDLRAPLRSLEGFSQALLEDHAPSLDDEAAKYCRYIGDSAREMIGMIDALLSLSRIGRDDLQVEELDLSCIARRVADRLRRSHEGRRIEFEIEEGLRARADERLLTVVFENLLGNAVKFTGKREVARIEVGRVRTSGTPYFFVRDNGAGFDPEFATRLFGLFQRLHRAEEFEGTGIGLATVRRVVQRHGGTIRAEGHPGEGATFFFSLGTSRVLQAATTVSSTGGA